MSETSKCSSPLNSSETNSINDLIDGNETNSSIDIDNIKDNTLFCYEVLLYPSSVSFPPPPPTIPPLTHASSPVGTI